MATTNTSNNKTKVTVPTLTDLQNGNTKYGLGCNDEILKEHQDLFEELICDFNFVDEAKLPRYISELKVDRTFRYPSKDENKYNAWYVKCDIQGEIEGKLSGKRIAIKDNIAIADIPMMNGSAVVEGFKPDHDATVVQRIIAEGGIIVGKTTCEDMCLSGASFHTRNGPVKNPINTDHTTGGSSSGNGAAIVNGEVDMAVGGDQGGSIRIPASNCGIVGLKPTHGLVPYTGAVPIIPCLDHLGPMSKTVEDCAILLEVIAGYDNGRDYRQRQSMPVPEYSKEIYPNKNIEYKLKIGILQEGVQNCDKMVQHVFQDAVKELQSNENLTFYDVSLPLHITAAKAFVVFDLMGCYGSMIVDCGFGMGVSGYQFPDLTDKLFNGYKEKGAELSEPIASTILLCNYIKEKYGPYHFAKASTILQNARQEYDKMLNEYDVLIMPTSPKTACKLPAENVPIKERISKALDMFPNTGVFDYTGHPALSLNCGLSEGLPVGMMIVGKYFDETTVLYVASVFENVLQDKN